jgi:hypothetical protein
VAGLWSVTDQLLYLTGFDVSEQPSIGQTFSALAEALSVAGCPVSDSAVRLTCVASLAWLPNQGERSFAVAGVVANMNAKIVKRRTMFCSERLIFKLQDWRQMVANLLIGAG